LKISSPQKLLHDTKTFTASQLIQLQKKEIIIFFFKSKRDPNKETLSETEHKVYGTIADEASQQAN